MIFEKETFGCEASGLSAGTIWSAGHGDLTSASDASLELCAKSMDFYRDIQDKGYDCGLKRSGNLILGCNDEEAQYLLDEHNTLISNGYKSEFLSSVEAVIAQEAALKGGSAIAALYTENSGYVDPLQATHAIKEAAMDSGLYVYEYSRVVNIERLPGDIMKPQFRQFWRVTTSDGTFIDAKHVVVAAGVWCPVLLFPLGIQV